MKTCKDCGNQKPKTDFYGVQNECKECTKARVRKYRADNMESVRAYDRQRGLDPKRQANNRANYRKRISTPEGREREWQKKRGYINSTKRAANIIVGNYLRDGKLIRQPCERCGDNQAVDAHHEDYSKPLDVMWLCKKHHGERHREINEEQRKPHQI